MQIRASLVASAACALVGVPLLAPVVGAAIDSASPSPASPTLVAQRAALNLAGEGEGTLSIGTRPNQTITFVSVISQPNRPVEISLRLADGTLQRWGGQQVGGGSNQASIRLTNAGEADASGTLTVRYQGNRLISLVGNGAIDGQRMSVRFTVGDHTVNPLPPDPPTQLAQFGQGLLGIQGRPSQPVTFASAMIQPDGRTELSVRLADGTLMSFGGQATRRSAYEVVVNLTSSGMADASGTANIRPGPNNGIVSLIVNGTLDGQTFFLQFSGQ